jgi:hypothetical protein
LKELASAICTEDTLEGKDIQPKVYVLADGGLDCYAIFPEQKRPTISKRRILTIVFPKTLKDFVLLHPILGHELGHALWRCSKHQKYIREKVIPQLLLGGIFSSQSSVAAHLFSPSAPADVLAELLPFRNGQIDQSNFFKWARWQAWVEEILCDLVGIVTFGPSFVAAKCELLYSLIPSGVSVGQDHPPVAWRVNLALRCAELSGYDQLPAAGDSMYAPLSAFWTRIKSFRATDPWHDVFGDDQLREALNALRVLLRSHPPSEYVTPDTAALRHLFEQVEENIPPVGFQIEGPKRLHHPAVDFRHMIYAGWLACDDTSSAKFATVNRLCQHAMMQQRAIDISLHRKSI